MQAALEALTLALESQLPAVGSSCTEYDLIKHLERQGLFEGLSEEPELGLFQRHFITKNALYRLRKVYAEQGIAVIDISATQISVRAFACEESTNALDAASASAALEAYYLDWSHFEKASASSVNELLQGFWRRMDEFLRVENTCLSHALEVLELNEMPENQRALRRAFRRRAQKLHPDRGGDHQSFVDLQRAYAQLATQFI